MSKGRLTPTDVADRLDKTSSSIVRAIKGLMKNNWVTRVGVGKRAYHSLTAREVLPQRKDIENPHNGRNR